jgi:hypothetical protein
MPSNTLNLNNSSYITESDTSFCNELREKMLHCLSKPFAKPMDYSICGALLTCICKVFGVVEFGRVATFLFVLQDQAIAGKIHHPGFLENVIINVLCDSSNALGLTDLNSTVMNIKNDRKSQNVWVEVMENEPIEKCLNLEFR